MLFIDDSGYKLTPGQTQKTIAIDNAAGSLVERPAAFYLKGQARINHAY
jgi:hypothetical protein